MKRIFVLTVIVLLLAVGCVVDPGISPLATPTLSTSGTQIDPVDVPTLPDFLEMLAGPAGWVLLGAVLSELCASWAWYNAQPDAIKRGLIIVASVVIATIARVMLTYIPASFWEATANYWYILAGVIVTYLGSQGWFQGVIKPARARKS